MIWSSTGNPTRIPGRRHQEQHEHATRHDLRAGRRAPGPARLRVDLGEEMEDQRQSDRDRRRLPRQRQIQRMLQQPDGDDRDAPRRRPEPEPFRPLVAGHPRGPRPEHGQ
jgi:hypothetical protein